MSQAVYFVTRYSVVGKAQHTWQIAKNADDHEDYRAKVLAPERLERRLKLFSEITVPSIKSQSVDGVSLNWLILIAQEIPESHLELLSQALVAVTEAGVRVDLLRVAPSDELADTDRGIYAGMGQAIRMTLERDLEGVKSTFATVRLDDDDALASDYAQRLTRYLWPEFAGMHISFSRGLQAMYAGGSQLVDTRVIDKPHIALGLALVNEYDPKAGFLSKEVHVHGFGNHANLTARTPVIVDGSGISYLRTLDESSDLGDSAHARNEPAALAEVAALGQPQLKFELATAAPQPQPQTQSNNAPKKRGLFRR
jgi:hypothetical protein